MGEGRLCDMINKVETRTVVTVDSICIQAYLVFKAGGGKKKKRGGREKSRLSPQGSQNTTS